MIFKNTLEHALLLDKQDKLRNYRKEFHLPKKKNGEHYIYLCGNSLGLQPKRTRTFLEQELKDWAQLGVEGHMHAKNPWLPYHEFLAVGFSKIVGANPSEVVAMNSLTVNLHLMMVSFYRPEQKKFKIIIEDDAFPSDIYSVNSQIEHHGLDPQEALIKIKPRKGEFVLRTQDILKIIEEQGDQIALIMLGGVNYYTGQVFDFKIITEKAHQKNITVGFDLAHGAGNVHLDLHKWDVDFAVWCSYKYLNSGPGSVAGAFIHERHHNQNLHRFAGWWGHNKDNRFDMPDVFDPIQSAEGWQLSNPPILSLAAIRASLSIFDEVGMESLVEKSNKMTEYLRFLLQEAKSNQIEIITPKNSGCQLSIRVKNGSKKLFDQITKKGVISDWREPDVIRIAPAPLYNNYSDLFKFYKILESVL
jgi:kynureninase